MCLSLTVVSLWACVCLYTCVCVCVCICMCYSVHLKYEIRENSAAGRHPGRLQKQLFSTQGCTRCKRCYCITKLVTFNTQISCRVFHIITKINRSPIIRHFLCHLHYICYCVAFKFSTKKCCRLAIF